MSSPASDASRPANEFFRHKSAEGSIQSGDGQRIAALPQPLLHSLHGAMVESLGRSSRDALYRTGFEWALQEMLRLNQQMHDKFGGGFDFWQMDAKFVLDSWWSPLESMGWGAATFDLSAVSRGIVLVELRSSAVAAALNGAKEPVCHLHAGLFAGSLSFFDRVERHAVEVQCAAMGHESCNFVVGPGADIDSAETWRKEGASAADIGRRFR